MVGSEAIGFSSLDVFNTDHSEWILAKALEDIKHFEIVMCENDLCLKCDDLLLVALSWEELQR